MITYVGSRKKTRIIGDDGHFCAVIACLVKHPFREYHEYIRVLFEPRIKLPVVVLRLWGRAIKPLGYLPPVLFQNKTDWGFVKNGHESRVNKCKGVGTYLAGRVVHGVPVSAIDVKKFFFLPFKQLGQYLG